MHFKPQTLLLSVLLLYAPGSSALSETIQTALRVRGPTNML